MSLLPRLSRLIIELSRRRVIRAIGFYLVTLWLLVQGVADIFPAFGLPDWSVRAFVAVGLLLLPVVIMLAWRYDLTPEGLVPDYGLEDTQATLTDFGDSSIVSVTWSDWQAGEQTRRFDREFTVGRAADNAIPLEDKRVSRHHARFYLDQGHWWVEDLGSSNGTFVDGEPVQRRRLEGEAVVRLHRQGPKLLLAIRKPGLSDTSFS
jgi:FHA domain